MKMIIDVDINHVIINGHHLDRPNGMSVSQWEVFWNNKSNAFDEGFDEGYEKAIKDGKAY